MFRFLPAADAGCFFRSAVVFFLAAHAEYVLTEGANYWIDGELEAEWTGEVLEQLIVLRLVFL